MFQLIKFLQSKQIHEAEKTLGLVHSEQSPRNAKSSLASASNVADDSSEGDGEETASEHSFEVCQGGGMASKGNSFHDEDIDKGGQRLNIGMP